MSDIEAPIISLSQEDQPERDGYQEKCGLSKNAIIVIVIFTIFGIAIILIASLGVVPLSPTIKALITVLGVILSTPILFLFFRLYHYFIPPLFPSIEDNENENETTTNA
ncbi:hypothetical protein M9Y10_002911 [Tritrichomonas musculus]|uniref:Uncharacterized protein n=1 Tax=Tritrichomonas musculus TaxID=1915356 RepID=A0ABR2LBH0_9EUKA